MNNTFVRIKGLLLIVFKFKWSGKHKSNYKTLYNLEYLVVDVVQFFPSPQKCLAFFCNFLNFDSSPAAFSNLKNLAPTMADLKWGHQPKSRSPWQPFIGNVYWQPLVGQPGPIFGTF